MKNRILLEGVGEGVVWCVHFVHAAIDIGIDKDDTQTTTHHGAPANPGAGQVIV